MSRERLADETSQEELYKKLIGGCPMCGADSDRIKKTKLGHKCRACGSKLL